MSPVICHKRLVDLGLVVTRLYAAKFLLTAAILCMARPSFAQCEAGQLTSPKGGEGDGFGGVGLDGDVAVVSDPLAFGLLGAAFVYRRNSDDPGDWVLEQVLMAPEPDPDDSFGGVAVSGQIIVVTARHTAAPEFNRGAAYVYRYDPASRQWQFEQQLLASDGEGGDLFGWSRAIDGDAILIGARDDVVNGVSQAGSAYVFRYNSQTKQWVEEAKLTDPEGEQRDLFGKSVCIQGDVALVGAHGNGGRAFVFRAGPTDPRTWSIEAELTPFDGGPDDRFGSSVALDNGVAVVGSPENQDQIGAA